MNIENLLKKIDRFRNSKTNQTSYQLRVFNYDNEYLTVKYIETSNASGGSSVINGKQWSILFNKKASFNDLENWKTLQCKMNDNLKLTPVVKGRNKGLWGIRIYKMAENPTDEIIKELLDFIFNM